MNGSLARVCALASLLGGTVSALPSDALLDSLQLAALEHEKGGRIDERDKTEVLLEMLARQRLVADSSPEIPKRRLDELDRARSTRSALETEQENSRRKPPAQVVRMLEDSTPPREAEPAPPPPGALPAAQPAAPARASSPSAAVSVCPGGPMGFHWIAPSASTPAPKGDGILDVKIRLNAPCGLSRIDLYVDDLPARSFPPPPSRAGVYEFSDHVLAVAGIHRLEVLACDTNSLCVRSTPLEARLTGAVPSWVPKAVGGLVAVCGLLGLSLLLRRRPHHSFYSGTAETRPSAVPVPEAVGLSGTLRKRLQQVAQEVGPAFPAVSLRLPDQPPPLSVDPESLGDAFSTLLRLHAKRAASGGQILIAMGQGPLSAEVVFEDTATSPEEGSVQAILDLARPRVRERMGLDRELEVALESFRRAGGSLVAEVRIDGGLRTRMKVPLAPVVVHPA